MRMEVEFEGDRDTEMVFSSHEESPLCCGGGIGGGGGEEMGMDAGRKGRETSPRLASRTG